jgi:hypothetical protein
LAERLIRDGKRDDAKRLYEELATGDGSFAAAARLAELSNEPDKRRELWRRVYCKDGSIRDENGIPWPTRIYAETRFGDLLAMRGSGVREDDWVATGSLESTGRSEPTSPVILVRSPISEDGPAFPRAGFHLPAYRPDHPILSRLGSPAMPAASGLDGPRRLVAATGDLFGLSFVYDRRYVVRWRPLDLYPVVVSPPPDRMAGLYQSVGGSDNFDLAQTTDGRMLVHDGPATPSREFPCTRKPWSEPPAYVKDDRFLIPDDGFVFLFDARAGKELARYTLPGRDSLTGELPRFRIHQGDPLLIIDHSHGVEVDRLRIDGLKRAWERSPVFVGRHLDDLAFEAGRFFTAADGTLTARDWKDSRSLWESPLPGLTDGTWKLAVAPQGLLVYPSEAVRRHPDLEPTGEFRRTGLGLFALLRAASRPYDVQAERALPILVIDPADGRLIQRLNFPAIGPAVGVTVTPKGVVVVTGKGTWTLRGR